VIEREAYELRCSGFANSKHGGHGKFPEVMTHAMMVSLLGDRQQRFDPQPIQRGGTIQWRPDRIETQQP
jgi:hypothetical protein